MAREIQGKRFGRLVVIKRVPSKPGDRNAMWNCRCDCGKFTVAAASNIGRTTFSCGCLAKETATKILRGNTHTLTHGMAGTPEYQTWTRIKLRCHDPNNPKYYAYGARGISVCERWRNSFENFYSDMGPKPSAIHSIDRIDNDGNYEPGNCRWALGLTQARNARFNRRVTIDGITLCVAEWCDILAVPRWKPYEMTRPRGRDRDMKPAYASIDKALMELYRQKHS
jgi:hypothetical protein